MLVGLFRSTRQIRQFDMLMSLVAKSSRQSCLSLDSVFCSRIGGNWFPWENDVRASLSTHRGRYSNPSMVCQSDPNQDDHLVEFIAV